MNKVLRNSPEDESCAKPRIKAVASSTMAAYRKFSVSNVGHEGHEAGALDRGGNGMLTNRGATGLAATNDLALTAGEFFEQFDVFEIDKNGTHTFAVRAQRIAFLAVNLGLGTFTIDTILLIKCRSFGHRIYSYS